jgi:hypothetical protein
VNPRGLAVVGVMVCGQVLFGLLATVALIAARRRTSRRVVVQIAVIIAFVESFILAVGASAVVAARGGSEAVSAALLAYAGIGWLVVQVAIVVWWAVAWSRARRD